MSMTSTESYEYIKRSYITYGEYILEGRALPSVIDGLKNVERRVLYTMLQLPKHKIEKSSAIEGDTLKLHPHGGAYGSVVKLANTVPSFITTQGNFGSRDYPASAHRYTSAGLSEFAYINYKYFKSSSMVDGELDGYKEPEYLPSLLPYGFLEGSEGIGSGITSNLPKLDALDMIDSIVSLLKTGKIKKLPKFDLGEVEILSTKKETDNILELGKGSVKVQGLVTRHPDDYRTVILKYRPDRKTESSLLKSLDGFSVVNLATHYEISLPKRSRISTEDLIKKVKKITRVTYSYNLNFYKGSSAILSTYEYTVNEMIRYLKNCIMNHYKELHDVNDKKLKLLQAIKILSSTSSFMTNLINFTSDEAINHIKSIYGDHELIEFMIKSLDSPLKSFTKDSSDEISRLEDLSSKYYLYTTDGPDLVNLIINDYKELKSVVQKIYKNKSVGGE